MQKGIAEINVSDSDELRLKKINENFKNIVTGATAVGAVSTVGGGYVRMVSSVGGTIATNPQFAGSLSNYLINAKYITAEKIGTRELLSDYVQTDWANIGSAEIGSLWAKFAYAENLTAMQGWFTSILTATKIQADAIVANSITADKLKLSNGEFVNIQDFVDTSIGLFKIINDAVLTAQGIDMADRIDAIRQSEGITEAEAVQLFNTGIDGTALVVGSVTADRIKVTDLEAFQATIGGFHINDPDYGGGLVDEGGLFQMLPNGYFRAGSTGTYIEVDPNTESGILNIECTTVHAQEDLTIASHWKWDFVPQSGALNLLYIGA